MTLSPARVAAALLFAALLLGLQAEHQHPSLAQVPTPTALPTIAAPNPTPVAPATAAFRDATGSLAKAPFATLADLMLAAGRVAAGKDADGFWRSVQSAGQMPLIFGNTAVFLFRGPASSVDWRGDFTRWNSLPPLRGKRLGRSDIWMATKTFPSDARMDYKVVLNGNSQVLDPLNKLTQMGGYGRNSVLQMPAYVYPQATVRRSASAQGTVSAAQLLASKHLKYKVRYWVYTPPGYAGLDDLPVVYLTDGQEYMNPEMGALPTILDNLIDGGTIRPVMAVFVDPRNPDTGENRRGPELLTNDRYEAFLTKELIPLVDAGYRTSRKAEDRAIIGTSLGGLHTTWSIMKNPQVFGLAGIQSPYYKSKPRVLGLFTDASRLPVKVFVHQGSYDLDVEGGRFLRDVLKAKGYEYRYLETNDGHSWGNWRGALDDMMVFFFGR